ncbi:nuclear-pore anchor isoform X3 [Pyrus x bretschneideri]|uniref:nuclear-pore anchor isoform X3 n=1 Tax=Pyrus x bretschneideri TaxID=225117 RepID=UPI00202EB667|nr:nuclear-pore anchor isoform X3 [Pyrus x bretschneideri]
MNTESDAERAMSEHLLTLKDINGLVDQNAQLRSLVQNLSDQLENREMEFKENFEMEIKKHTDEAASRVAAVLQRAEERGCMIESLHTFVNSSRVDGVALKYCDHGILSKEVHVWYCCYLVICTAIKYDRKYELMWEATRKAQDQAAERVKCLEEDLAKTSYYCHNLGAYYYSDSLQSSSGPEQRQFCSPFWLVCYKLCQPHVFSCLFKKKT